MEKVIRVQGSGFSIQRRTVVSGQWAVVGAKPQAVSIHNSSLITHPSTLNFRPSGYTLVEILIATALTLLLMGVVVQLFGALGQSITDSRSTLESSERLRSAAARLQMDLEGLTVTMLPPRTPEDGEGYFEYIEGPVMQSSNGDIGGPPLPVNSEAAGAPLDNTVGDFDDILLFTTRSKNKSFIGNGPVYNNVTGLLDRLVVQADVAEVAWFIRGRTLYRRQLIVAPGLWNNLPVPVPALGYYINYDVSVRANQVGGVWQTVPNTLSDLTRRECRFGHPTGQFPFDARYWGQLGMPTLRECSDPGWIAGIWSGYVLPAAKTAVDFWSNDPTQRFADNELGNGSRIADDVILTSVIGFDVKVWDSGVPVMPDSVTGKPILPGDANYPNPPNPAQAIGFGGYVDLGYSPLYAPSSAYPQPYFNLYGDPSNKSQLNGSINRARVYDTWSTHYETAGLYGLDPTIYPPGRGTNGFDDNNDGVVDDENEKLTSPPYPYPLRGIQIKIRVFEPDSRQIQEVTIVQDFLPK
jgi:hypothetical protein